LKAIDLHQTAIKAVGKETTAPVFTIGLREAAKPRALLSMTRTGQETASEFGVQENSPQGKAVSFRLNATGKEHAREVMAAKEQLSDSRVLQIPSLLVTALVGTNDQGSTVVRPIDNIPAFLEPRIYTGDEFENVVRVQAALKLRALSRLDPDKGVF
jgi:hypothetical protein